MINSAPITATFENDQLKIGGVFAKDLITQYGTPLYVMDYETIRYQSEQYTDVLKKKNVNSQVLFAGKAHLNTAMVQLVSQLGLGVDVVSIGELETVLNAKAHGDSIGMGDVYFHGNNKSIDELTLAISKSVTLVVDNEQELEHIVSICDQTGQQALLMLRLKPGIDVHTHKAIQTGQADSKFGMDKPTVLKAVERINRNNRLTCVGLHSHIGSQIFNTDPYLEQVDTMVSFMNELRQKTGRVFPQLNLGGGIGIYYTEGDTPPDISLYLEKVIDCVTLKCRESNYPLPKLLFEPGRSICGRAGCTLYTVGTVESLDDVTFLAVDGGMADNPRYSLYKAKYTFLPVEKKDSPVKVYSVVGRFCESGDKLGEQIEMPEMKPGEGLVVFGTGAYNYSMASNYNRFTRPAVVLVKEGEVFEMVHRETVADILKNDCILPKGLL